MPLDPMDDNAQVGSPSGEETPIDEGGAEQKVLALIQDLCKDKTTPHKVKRKMVMHALSMLQGFAPEQGEPVEPEEPMEPMEAVGTPTINAGDITPRKGTEGSETRYARGEGINVGGVARGRTETMEAQKKSMKMREDVSVALQQLKDTQDPANVLLAESLGQQFTKELQEEQELRDKLDRYEATEAITKKRTLALDLCKKAKLPEQTITEAFQTQLINARDEKEMKDLIEDRRYISSIQRPISRHNYIGHVDNDKPADKGTAANVPTDQAVAGILRRSRGN